MKTPGFLGLPENVQALVLERLDAEIEAAKAQVAEVEQSKPVDRDLLKSLQGDIAHTEDLRTRMVNGQA
ncbi:hypothetical protein G7066_01265 [Leucobacter coleopterorum]|uniref:Uncharacterized protein n=1 Tax=Leucobacter coleopterorum TaxID=2714933 RepID=A0ABX6JY25_9MICO|nr:hypothetical protein [Leucobacter coleopterorum]QIM17675.1 hypothetical protein G7066_01265 [Leucobacter coleopterorum]